MAIEYMGLNNIQGPLAVIEGVDDTFYEEMVTVTLDNGEKRIGRVIEISGDKAVIQVFEGTSNLSLTNTKTKFMGEPMRLPLSKEMLGRTLDGIGRPIDGLGDYFADEVRDVNGQPINPVSREYPNNFIQTGISSIDCLATLIRGQKLPIFSGDGLPHDDLAVQIARQAKVVDPDDENGGKGGKERRCTRQCGVHADDYEHVGRHGQHDCRQNEQQRHGQNVDCTDSRSVCHHNHRNRRLDK